MDSTLEELFTTEQSYVTKVLHDARRFPQRSAQWRGC
jgi:hypothetical protein